MVSGESSKAVYRRLAHHAPPDGPQQFLRGLNGTTLYIWIRQVDAKWISANPPGDDQAIENMGSDFTSDGRTLGRPLVVLSAVRRVPG